MLRFKQFISVYLTEATIKHFAHLGLDPDNQEHNDLVDAYNLGHSKNDPNVPRNPNQIKSMEHLTKVANSVHNPEEDYSNESHLGQIRRKRQEKQDDERSIRNGHAELVHHDINTGLKVFKVISSKGCSAVGSNEWCVSNRKVGQEHFDEYDPEGEHSYVIHTPEKGNLSKIGIIGVKPGEKPKTGAGGNFQDKGNIKITDKDWEMLRKKYNLDSVPHLHGIRGLKNPEIEKEQQQKSALVLDKIKQNKFNIFDDHQHITPEHITHPDFNVDSDTLYLLASRSDNPEIHNAIIQHKNVTDNVLSKIAAKTKNPEIHNAIINHDKVDEKTLDRIAEKSDNYNILTSIVGHKKTPSYTINNIIKNSSPHDAEMHLAALNNPNSDKFHITSHISGLRQDYNQFRYNTEGLINTIKEKHGI